MENLPLMMSEVVWMEEACHDNFLPIKEENCKQEATPASFDHVQSSEESIEENICTSEEIKCVEGWDSEILATKVLDVKEETIVEDENTLTSQVEESVRLSPAHPKSQCEEIVCRSYTYYCTLCYTSYRSQSVFDSHITNTHKVINIFQCPTCEKNFKSWSELVEHFVIHSDAKKFCCKICEKQLTCKGDLQKHLFTHSIICNVCDRKFKCLPDLKRHMFIHYEREHYCYKCKELLHSDEELKQHNSTVHTRSKEPLECPLCRKSFSFYSRLMEHMDVHFSKSNNACHICEKIFCRRSDQIRHTQEHASCNTCSTRILVKRGPKGNYPCKVCGKVFLWPSKFGRTYAKARRGEQIQM